tara:strand:+ start:1285 stop:2166 length:882 start_codon:yes stop_codon:yes gene_type:complete
MISILIPCFDYNAYPLVSILEKQALMLKIDFEIICIDDGSFSSKNDLNQKINLLTNSKFIELKKNIGRINNRLLLAEKSQYEWLIFLDVDTLPNEDNFLKNYIDQLNKGTLIIGGCTYKKPDNENFSLRYKFGKFREEIKSDIRNKNPYKYISSCNFMCKRDVLIDILASINTISYGNDYVFGSLIKKKEIDIKHIDNPVLIDNIDENQIFINKTHHALDNLISSYNKKIIKKHSISILKAYIILDTLLMKNIFVKITDLFKNLLNRNLHSKDPNLFLFDLYRLNYLCKIKNA